MEKHLDRYAREREEMFEKFKEIALETFKEGKMTSGGLEFILKTTFQHGHYVGHCRGEKYVKDTFGIN